ncbi:hypothetical protein EKO04_008082 [Ascochyta lentis]|uniref:Uncharacterized protein n=1 Tax=Ascochyta lentis TaxID=205686 RepID=A0A8H7MGL3_9PLEO|nr:hypothetical protein EKO04_008082 [Ascochyta lentis]
MTEAEHLATAVKAPNALTPGRPRTLNRDNELATPRSFPSFTVARSPQCVTLSRNYTFYIDHTSDDDINPNSNTNNSHSANTSNHTLLPTYYSVKDIDQAEAALFSCPVPLSPSSCAHYDRQEYIVAAVRSSRERVDIKMRGCYSYDADDEAESCTEGSGIDESSADVMHLGYHEGSEVVLIFLGDRHIESSCQVNASRDYKDRMVRGTSE